MTTIAIMQPYFAPYTGYFRLIDRADIFVLYDCVQFQRRGWMHRNQLHDQNGEQRWLTLPIQKCPQNTLIKDLEFSTDAKEEWRKRLMLFQHLRREWSTSRDIWEQICTLRHKPSDYISTTLQYTADILQLSTKWIRSSDLQISEQQKGEARIIAIMKELNGTTYLNSPGGIDLYNPDNFRQEGLQLEFLSPYEGPKISILERILTEKTDDIIQSIRT